MSKHQLYDLKQMQSVPLEGKILMTQRRIQEWYDYYNGEVYVSFSGGKDSTVLKHIVDQMYSDVPALFVNTGLEYPEIQKFAMSQKNVVTVRPEMRFDEVVKVYGYPVISKSVSHAVKIARRNPDGKVMKNRFNPEDKGRFLLSPLQNMQRHFRRLSRRRPPLEVFWPYTVISTFFLPHYAFSAPRSRQVSAAERDCLFYRHKCLERLYK